MEEAPVFRASKRRKLQAKHSPEIEDNDLVSDEEFRGSVIKVKRQKIAKRGGVQFSNTKNAVREDHPDGSVTRVTMDIEDEAPVGGLDSRFIGAGSSTRVMNIDKDMYVLTFLLRGAKVRR